ncbi:DUF6461 domain-containing protein [Streptomyces sp. URMC 124]|uniref:DUF6461 domain-containing protein n=1 Tax=Streptomyces sp. URMC 124 TaxID=3423405 RepID=UPI003F1DC3F4
MRDGIQWLFDLHIWDESIVFARGIGPEELATRMGGDLPGAGRRPISDMEAWDAVANGLYRPGEDGDGLIRVGRSGDWSFALEYGDSTGHERLPEVSRQGAEAIRLDPAPAHPPKVLDYARDGKLVCRFDLGEEHEGGERRTVGIVESHFGLSLPREPLVGQVVLPFYVVRGTPEIEDFEETDDVLVD